MNLIEDRWIPIRRQSGLEERIAPWQLTESFADDPVVSLSAPRPDFQGGLVQFLIGLLQTATPPNEDKGPEWGQWLEKPPEPEVLQKALAPYAKCFQLDGDGPRFMQDFDLKEGKENGIGSLLIDTPGENALRQNTDHFIKRGRVEGMCRACAATALFTLQTNAPAGGKGNRTSLRGGGPLTTLVVLDPQGSGLHQETLWHNVWLNILERRVVENLPGFQEDRGLSDTFPWLAPTRTSEAGTGCETSPVNIQPLQMYWGMPRRIRLDFERMGEGICDICGEDCGALIGHFFTSPYGINYTGAYQHPLSPHRIEQDGSPMPLHPQPGGFTYRHWSGLVEENETCKPARVVTEFKNRILQEEQFRIWAFGYDMVDMKPRCWYEIVFPLYLFADDERRKDFAIRVQELIEAAAMAAGFVRSCVKEAWFRRPGDVRGDTAFITESFLSETEASFFSTLEELFAAMKDEDSGLAVLSNWYGVLCRAAVKLFDDWATRQDWVSVDPKRIADARKKLLRQLNGKKLRGILHLPARRKEKAV